MLRSSGNNNTIDTVVADRLIGRVGKSQIVRLVLRNVPEVTELRKVVCHIERYMRKEAKYKGKRPVVSSEMRLRLTKDDMDLGVTICHIREDPFRTGAHILSISDNDC
jgi:hypothetical protein